MNRFKKVFNIAYGVCVIIMSVLLCLFPEDGYRWVVFFIGTSLVLAGIKNVYFYFTMARYMVGGKYILYLSIIMIQFGFFTWDLEDVPKFYVIMYLAAMHAILGMIGILNARESLHYKSPAYKKGVIEGSVNLVIAILCIIFIRYLRTAVFIYAAGFFWSGLMRIRKAFDKQEMVYIR